MKLRRIALLGVLGAIGALGSLGAAPASAATTWNLDLHHNQTNFPPGGDRQYWVDTGKRRRHAPAPGRSR